MHVYVWYIAISKQKKKYVNRFLQSRDKQHTNTTLLKMMLKKSIYLAMYCSCIYACHLSPPRLQPGGELGWVLKNY